MNTIYVLSNDNGTLVTYNEASVTPVGTVALVAPAEQTLTLAYNQAMFAKIQRTQIQDIPTDNYAKTWAYQQISEVFIPAHDAYSIAKLVAARPIGNKVVAASASWVTDKNLSLKFEQAINLARTNGNGDSNMMVAWVSYAFAANLASQITFTGSDAGYKDSMSGYLGKHKGVKVIEVKDSFFGAGVFAVVADKRAIVAVKPKMSPEDIVVIDKVPGFGGIEVQLRDRGDTFVLTKKAGAIATIENV